MNRRSLTFKVMPWMQVPVITGLLGIASHAHAGMRKFTHVYEVTTNPKGSVEYEQWVSWKTSKREDSKFDRLDFRHELELGLTDKLQLGIYLVDWRYQDGRSVSNDRVEYRDTAFELIYNLTNPVKDPLGLALYGEAKIGDQLAVLEAKILLQKDFGPWTVAYNAVVEAEWEGSHYEEDIGVFEQTFGVSYQIVPKFLIGGELVHEVEFEDWEETGDHVVYVGPNFSYRAEKWWVTVTPLFQATELEGEADFFTRLIFGIDF